MGSLETDDTEEPAPTTAPHQRAGRPAGAGPRVSGEPSPPARGLQGPAPRSQSQRAHGPLDAAGHAPGRLPGPSTWAGLRGWFFTGVACAYADGGTGTTIKCGKRGARGLLSPGLSVTAMSGPRPAGRGLPESVFATRHWASSFDHKTRHISTPPPRGWLPTGGCLGFPLRPRQDTMQSASLSPRPPRGGPGGGLPKPPSAAPDAAPPHAPHHRPPFIPSSPHGHRVTGGRGHQTD